MTVKVSFISKASGRPETGDHSTGTGVSVHDGHLIVFKEYANNQPAVAVYAPGTWFKAEVDD